MKIVNEKDNPLADGLFIAKRIKEQCEYLISIPQMHVSIERQYEIFESAAGQLKYLSLKLAFLAKTNME